MSSLQTRLERGSPPPSTQPAPSAGPVDFPELSVLLRAAQARRADTSGESGPDPELRGSLWSEEDEEFLVQCSGCNSLSAVRGALQAARGNRDEALERLIEELAAAPSPQDPGDEEEVQGGRSQAEPEAGQPLPPPNGPEATGVASEESGKEEAESNPTEAVPVSAAADPGKRRQRPRKPTKAEKKAEKRREKLAERRAASGPTSALAEAADLAMGLEVIRI